MYFISPNTYQFLSNINIREKDDVWDENRDGIRDCIESKIYWDIFKGRSYNFFLSIVQYFPCPDSASDCTINCSEWQNLIVLDLDQRKIQ